MTQNEVMAVFFGGVGGFAIVFAFLNRLKKPKSPDPPPIVVDSRRERDP